MPARGAGSHLANIRDVIQAGEHVGTVESFTVIYRGNGEVEHGVVMLRTEDGKRTLARIPTDDAATLAHLRDMDRTPVGSLGDITMAGDGAPVWRMG